jgi:hypothetical protein
MTAKKKKIAKKRTPRIQEDKVPYGSKNNPLVARDRSHWTAEIKHGEVCFHSSI